MSVVNEIKSQYVTHLRQKDWRQFKLIAEYYFKVAASLRKSDIKSKSNKLLLRNSQKRLYLGIGCELLIKSFYLKEGYCVNKFATEYSGDKTPTHKLSALVKSDINYKDTYTLGALIDNLNKIISLSSHADIKRGFQIAMVFRNKEGHVTFPSHDFDEQNYRDIENAVKSFYKEAFGEKLSFHVSMKPNEKHAFKVNT
ncbi:MAG: hypothetical protein ACC707_21365 [Thiohalomonadales bacterium]